MPVFLTDRRRELGLSLGLLVLRLATAAMMAGGHGWTKLSTFSFERAADWADPIGVGGTASLMLAVFAEFFCSIAVALGLFTRLAAVPLLITMLVAVLVVHAHDPWAKKEFALLYAIPFLTLILAGPGRFSLDELIRRRFTSASGPSAARS